VKTTIAVSAEEAPVSTCQQAQIIKATQGISHSATIQSPTGSMFFGSISCLKALEENTKPLALGYTVGEST
jgi:hypothetical protein